VFDYFKKHPKLAATFATKWVNTKLLDYVPENKIRVRMSLMPEKMRAILENGTSPIIKEFSSWRSFSKQDTLHQFQSNYLPRQKTEWYKELFNIINNEVSEEFKNKPVSNVFSTHNANLHKINLEKAFKARRNTLDTREPRTENQSVWRLKPGTINV
jgi:spore photoproduct lyase